MSTYSRPRRARVPSTAASPASYTLGHSLVDTNSFSRSTPLLAMARPTAFSFM